MQQKKNDKSMKDEKLAELIVKVFKLRTKIFPWKKFVSKREHSQ